MKEFSKWFSSLPAVLQIIIVILIVITVWYVWNYAKSAISSIQDQATDKGEMHALATQGIKPNYTDSQYESYADDLFDAMDGLGTTWPTIDKVFTAMKNDADILKLETAFGLRASSYSSSWFTDPTDLKDWLRGDLGEDLMDSLNNQLKKKGITKQF